MKTNSMIVYTSSDSVLQIAAHEETFGLEELYRCCHIAREICMKPEWMVGRIIARPFIGTNKDDLSVQQIDMIMQCLHHQRQL